MASSSSSSIPKSYTYDVFLSFRGEDTRKNFVDHLYMRLQEQGIHTFKDDERLEKGKRINDELLKAIEESKFFIIVFSKDYASSSWCLYELAKIMECQKEPTGLIAIPVFYDVDPSEVRKQLAPVGEAFSKHNKEEVGKWIEALEEAANLAGWDVRKTADGHEAKVIKLIVERISRELRSINYSIDENLVGMETRIKHLESSLEIGKDDVRMIGIRGIGGGGKTTLAREVFKKLSIDFEGTSFVENVREVSNAYGLKKLQKQVLRDVLNDKGIEVSSVHEGKSMMKKMLLGKKVLIVLDDVDHGSQLEALAGATNWFKPGSRIIITTRNKQVLVAHDVKRIHDVNLLSDDEAICLFSRYAFHKDLPTEGYKKLSQQVVGYAAGLPLTLKVLGLFLCGGDKLHWTDAVERQKTIPLNETLEILELSYNGLEVDYKEIFLDVACFFKGWSKDDAIRALESCGYRARNGLRVLELRSLITISYGCLSMHDHMQEMGRFIVRRLHPDEANKHSRLWIRKEIEDILANDSGTEEIRAIAVAGPLELSDEVVMKGFGNMKKLRFLRVDEELIDYTSDDSDISSGAKIDQVSGSFPDALRVLHWDYYPRQSLPRTFLANNLVSLQMHKSRIVQLWEGGERKVLNKLRFLDLSWSKLRNLDLGVTPNLERLNLEQCHDLEEVHAPVGCLKNLVYLNLIYCWKLESLSFIKELESLEELCVSKLYQLEFPRHCNISLLEIFYDGTGYGDELTKELSSLIGNLHKLVNLDLNFCTYLKSLPGSICGLQRLSRLDLSETRIEELPEDLGHLACLVELYLGDTSIRHLPDSICLLKNLKTLDLSWCTGLEKLPEDLGLLKSLEKLYLRGCSEIKDIPDSICKLKLLRYLDLWWCHGLEKLPKELGRLESLEELDVRDTFIRHLPESISLLKGLKIIGFKPDTHFIDLTKDVNAEDDDMEDDVEDGRQTKRV